MLLGCFAAKKHLHMTSKPNSKNVETCSRKTRKRTIPTPSSHLSGMPIFHYFLGGFFCYFWPDPFSADPFPCMLIFSIFSYFVFLFLNFLFVFIFCETAHTHRFSVIFAKVQWHPWFMICVIVNRLVLDTYIDKNLHTHSHAVENIKCTQYAVQVMISLVRVVDRNEKYSKPPLMDWLNNLHK